MPKSQFWQRNSPHLRNLAKKSPKRLQIGVKVAKICSIFWRKIATSGHSGYASKFPMGGHRCPSPPGYFWLSMPIGLWVWVLKQRYNKGQPVKALQFALKISVLETFILVLRIWIACSRHHPFLTYPAALRDLRTFQSSDVNENWTTPSFMYYRELWLLKLKPIYRHSQVKSSKCDECLLSYTAF